MASSAPPNPSAASSSSSTSDPSPFATLPTELKLEILAWTGIASPRALCNLASTNRQLRKLSEPMRWKNLPISPDHLDRLSELVDTFLPLYGHHIRLLRLYAQKGSEFLPRKASFRYHTYIRAAALPLMTSLRHLDVSATHHDPRSTELDGLLQASPFLAKSLTSLTMSVTDKVSGVPIGALLKRLPLLTTLRLGWWGNKDRDAVAGAFLSLHHLKSLRLTSLSPKTMRQLRCSPQAPLTHLDMRNCAIDLHDVQSLLSTHQATLTSLVLHDLVPPRTSRPLPTFNLPHLHDLSIEGYGIHPTLFTSSPLRTLRCDSNPDDSIDSLLQFLDEHRSTLQKVRVHNTSWSPTEEHIITSRPSLEEVATACRERGIDFAEGSWIVDEWEEHFGKWM